MSNLIKKTGLLLGTLIFGLLLCEIIVRALVPVRNIGPSFTTSDPDYGKRLKRSFVCTRITPEFTMRFKTNSLGFRGEEPDTYPQRPLLFLGDSFTMGYGVNDGEEFPSLIKKEMDGRYGPESVPVVNGGIGDSGNGWTLKFLKNEGLAFGPRAVILQISRNDFGDNNAEGMFVLKDNGELFEAPVLSSSGKRRFLQTAIEAIPGLPYSYLVGLARQSNSASYSEKEGADILTYSLINEILSACASEDTPVIVLLVGLEGERLERISRICGEYDAPVINVPLKDNEPLLYYKIDGHWNSRGHEYVAGKIIHLLDTEHNFKTILPVKSGIYNPPNNWE